MTYKNYIIGFVSSLILTFMAYFSVTEHIAFGVQLTLVLAVLALVQAAVQLELFLHVRERSSSPSKLASFAATFVMLLILVVGSVWIMNNLNYNMEQLSPDAKTVYMIQKNGAGGF